MTPLRTFVLEDETLVRKLLVMTLKAMPEVEVVGESGDGVEGERMILELKPDLVLLDINLPNRDGVTVARRALGVLPDLRIVAISSHVDPLTVQTTLQLGFTGYVDKFQPPEAVSEAVREASQGRHYFSHNALMALRQITAEADGGRKLLTAQETEVLRHLAGGRSNKEIAELLGVSVRTVESHRFNLRKKLDLSDTASLTRYAMQIGLASN